MDSGQHIPENKVHGPTWDPAGAERTQVGPMLAPWTLLSGIGFFPICTAVFSEQSSLQWHYCHGVSYHWQIDCSCNSFISQMTKQILKFRITGTFVRGIQLLDFPHKGPVMWDTFPSRDMINKSLKWKVCITTSVHLNPSTSPFFFQKQLLSIGGSWLPVAISSFTMMDLLSWVGPIITHSAAHVGDIAKY